ncbi:MAG: pseudaminic acid synthase [Magnetospirillum sp.]|nr:pseudaminic acid synthase [Magnetospirillum sp.]
MSQPSAFAIAGRLVGPGHAPYVIAEMSGNHNGDIGRAFTLIDAAAEAGADAVKLQTYTADTITIDHHGPGFDLEDGLWAGRSLYELYQEAHTPWDWHPALFEHARKRGITAFSTPFDATAVDFLHGLDAPAYKIASFELVDLPLVALAARTGRPLIMSTGMASEAEIAEAVSAARDAGATDICLLHCVSGYPTPAGEANLARIGKLARDHGVTVGLSDHTMGVAVPIAAVALGACVIEKHFTLRRADGGPDCEFSLEPEELKALVEGTRIAWEAIGSPEAKLKPSEEASLSCRRSLYVVADIKAGETITEANVRSIRPGYGMAPKELPRVLGKRAKGDLARGTPLDWSMVEG